MSKKKAKRRAPGAGRPVEITDDTLVCIAPGGSSFQKGSLKRAILDVVLDSGGCISLGELDSVMRHDVRPQVMALRTGGWLEISE